MQFPKLSMRSPFFESVVRLVKRIFSNFYLAGAVLFCLWMLFLDSNDLVNQLRLKFKLESLKRERVYYQKQIEEVKADREQLLSDEELLEKYARERYHMKKPGEDLYIIVDE